MTKGQNQRTPTCHAELVSASYQCCITNSTLTRPFLNFFHAHRVSAKELRSKSLNLFAIRHKCRTEIRSARLADESLTKHKASLVRDISLTLNMTNTFCLQFFIKGTGLLHFVRNDNQNSYSLSHFFNKVKI